MFWDDLDYTMNEIFSDVFCEQSIAIPLKTRHDIHVRNVLKNDTRRQQTITTIHNRKVIKPKGRAARPFFFRKIYMSYNERTTVINGGGAQLTTAPSPFTRSVSTISNGIKRLLTLLFFASAHLSGQPRRNNMPYNERVHISNNVEESAAMQTLLFFAFWSRDLHGLL